MQNLQISPSHPLSHVVADVSTFLDSVDNLNAIDALGVVRAALKALSDREAALKETVANVHSEGKTNGAFFAATVSLTERKTLNAKRLAEICGATGEQIAQATTTAAVVTIRTVAI